MTIEIAPVVTLEGEWRPPSDKSLTHRAYMLGAIAKGDTVIKSALRGEDCESTLRCLVQMGLDATWLADDTLMLRAAPEWRQPEEPLDCGNSGTTMRLLAGLVASRPLDVTMVGDKSLSRRPMRRIADPLRLMGAEVEGETPPLRVVGGQLQGIDYVSLVASAQVKSSILLAGLRAEGCTRVSEPTVSRDHTERMLEAMGCRLDRQGSSVSLAGGQELRGFDFTVPGDISSAAFFMVAAAMLPQSRLLVRDLSVNPTRTGIFDVFAQCEIPLLMGDERSELGEPVTEIEVRHSATKKPFLIEGGLVPRLIDEIPVLAVLATQCAGTSVIRGAKELRVKESDRIELVAAGLRQMGVSVETFEDGMAIEGPAQLQGATIDAHGDHRIAMAFAIAALSAHGESRIEGAEAIATSYPDFETDLQSLCVI